MFFNFDVFFSILDVKTPFGKENPPRMKKRKTGRVNLSKKILEGCLGGCFVGKWVESEAKMGEMDVDPALRLASRANTNCYLRRDPDNPMETTDSGKVHTNV